MTAPSARSKVGGALLPGGLIVGLFFAMPTWGSADPPREPGKDQMLPVTIRELHSKSVELRKRRPEALGKKIILQINPEENATPIPNALTPTQHPIPLTDLPENWQPFEFNGTTYYHILIDERAKTGQAAPAAPAAPQRP